MAPQLAQQWAPGVSWAWTKVEGAWDSFLSERGGWQGSPDSNPSFCYGLEDVFDEGLAGAVDVQRLGYADDTFLDGTPESLLAQWPLLQAAFEAAGREAQPPTCHLLTHLDDAGSGHQAYELAHLGQIFDSTTGPLTIMGPEAGAR